MLSLPTASCSRGESAEGASTKEAAMALGRTRALWTAERMEESRVSSRPGTAPKLSSPSCSRNLSTGSSVAATLYAVSTGGSAAGSTHSGTTSPSLASALRFSHAARASTLAFSHASAAPSSSPLWIPAWIQAGNSSSRLFALTLIPTPADVVTRILSTILPSHTHRSRHMSWMSLSEREGRSLISMIHGDSDPTLNSSSENFLHPGMFVRPSSVARSDARTCSSMVCPKRRKPLRSAPFTHSAPTSVTRSTASSEKE
mmetsp:Transcript_46207/g.92366  ORF Transcript_46207/g.92366 Transcript_46207/m.92366 type:complete len:258 (-) Transcript_46207:642-1415(-)